ncbi:MAG TPA: hypothetical protein VEJ89_04070, partial [Myxococcaceae bacterium]|nr:hypothetical protein [Myxococcaceae bacterium]
MKHIEQAWMPRGLVPALWLVLVPSLALGQAPLIAPAPGATTASPAQPAPQPPPPASQVTPDPWPKSAEVGGTKYTLYQPQLDAWDNYVYKAHAAVSVLPAGSKDPIFGVVEISAYTVVDKAARAVHFDNLTITQAKFPSAPQMASTYQQTIQALLSQGPATMSLGRLEAAVAIEGAERKAERVPVLNEPPRIVFGTSPMVLVLIHGEPAWRPVSGTSLTRVINTRALVLSDPSGNVYVHVLDGFMTAPSLNGPWTVSWSPPPGANQVAQQLAQKNIVDLMQGPVNETTGQRPSLAAGAPGVVVATRPTEIVITQGPMNWVPLEGTQLLYVSNTNGNVFQDMVNQQFYVLVTGRWFQAAQLGGPWSFIPGTSLPVDFTLIPDTSPKENVKASIPGTPQAQEAAIAAQIPQMATIYRAKVSFQPVVNGAPVLQPIPGTPLSYVFNSPDAIIQVAPNQWYAVQMGVWFTAPSLQGPWVVATSVPPVLYSIPPSAPLFYVTFVYIYAVTPTTVTVGYTPGYMGVVVEPGGTVVYGTGYTYVAYVSTTVYYPPPVTYGYAANVTYTPWTGFAVGFAIGWGVAHACYAPAPYWGPMPYAYHGAAYGAYGGAAAWGPGGWAATSGNMYHQYGATSAVTRDSAGYNAWTGNAWSSKVGTSYNSVTGRTSAGQTASVSNAYTGGYAYGSRGATYNPNTGVTASGGKETVGNAYTGQSATYGHATVTGPGGQSTSVAEKNNEYYADHDGNVYNYNSSTGQAQKYNSSTGTWSNTDKPTTTSSSASSSAYKPPSSSSTSSYSKPPSSSSYQSSAEARQAGDAKSASSSWGGSWGGSSSHSGDSWGSSSGSWGGGESHSGGSEGGGGHSWGGGGW